MQIIPTNKILTELNYSRQRLSTARNKYLIGEIHFIRDGKRYLYTDKGLKELLKIQKKNKKFQKNDLAIDINK